MSGAPLPPPGRPPGVGAVATPRWNKPLQPDEWISDEVVKHFKSQIHLCSLTEQNRNNKDFWFWLEYFWKEARGVTPEARHKELIKILFAAPNFTAAEINGFRSNNERRDLIDLRGKAAITSLDGYAGDDNRKRQILTLLLQIGFRDMSTPVAAQYAAPATQKHFRHQIVCQDGIQGKRVNLRIGIRGDGSSFADMIAEKGRENRVDKGLCNMNAKWHPFSLTRFGGKLWFRRGSGDNCLYSVTSVSDKMSLGVGFPLIEDEAIYPETYVKKPLATWSAIDFQAAQAQKVFVSIVELACGGERKYGALLCTESYLYVCKMSGESVNTAEQAAVETKATYADQSTKCDERGIRGVPLSDFLVGFKLRRYHFGRSRTEGLAAWIEECKYFFEGAWHDWSQETDGKLAAQHFYGDVQAASRLTTPLRKILDGTRLVQGENDSTNGTTKNWVFKKCLKWGITDPQEFQTVVVRPGLIQIMDKKGFVFGDSGI